MEPDELRALVTETGKARDALGVAKFEFSEKENKSRLYRRSIYISFGIRAGKKLTLGNVKVIRPSLGLEPIYLENVLGKEVRVDLKIGTPLKWDHLRGN